MHDVFEVEENMDQIPQANSESENKADDKIQSPANLQRLAIDVKLLDQQLADMDSDEFDSDSDSHSGGCGCCAGLVGTIRSN